jgi:predicted Zn-dependent protease
MNKINKLAFICVAIFVVSPAGAFDFGAIQAQVQQRQQQLQQEQRKVEEEQQRIRLQQQQLQQQPTQLIQQLPVSPAAISVIKEVAGPTQEEEIAIGRQIAGNLLGASALVKDPQLQRYVNKVGRWVANQSERPDLPWHFGVIESTDINAFAMPGGYIFVTKGLYKLLQNEAELAGVLGHEIGHVIRKHHLKILQQSKLLDAGSQVLTQRVGNNEALQKVIGSGAEIMSRSLDKGAEFEADSIGVVLVTRAGYDAYGLPSVLQLIGHSASSESNVALLFKTHPLPEERLDKLSQTMGDRFDRIKGETLAQRLYRLK